MHSKPLENLHTERWFYIFLNVHIILWTLVPAIVRYNLPLDSIEGTIWGHHLQWGYDKNPFLNGWLTALATFLDGQTGMMIYLFSQLSVAAGLWSVWQLAKKMLPSVYALVAVLILEGVQYFNFHAVDFNDNTLELGLWALTIYSFYQSLTTEKNTKYWILTGVFAALGMMAKYYTATLLLTMFLFLLIYPENRKHIFTTNFYLGVITFLAIIAPHLIWLYHHDFITIHYVFARGSTPPTWFNHIFIPSQFIWQQLQVFLPAVLLFACLFIGKPSLATEKIHLSSFNKRFLCFICFGPMFITSALAFLLGTKLRAGWGMPLLSFWGILLIATLQPNLTKQKLQNLTLGIFILLITLTSAYTISLIHSPDASSANFPGRDIAYVLTQKWRETYHTKLSYVAGSRWLGGNVGFYSPDHPSVFMEWNSKHSPWINLDDFKKHGAIFLWDITNNETLPIEIEQQFPNLVRKSVMLFPLHRNTYHLAPVKIGIAYLPPKHH